MSSVRKRSRLKSSTEYEASTEPRIIAVRMSAGAVPPARASQPMNPPANESPAPVGSTTVSIGKAGAANTPALVEQQRPGVAPLDDDRPGTERPDRPRRGRKVRLPR